MKKTSKRKFLYLFNLMIIVSLLSLIGACGGGGGGGDADGDGTTATNNSTLTLEISSNTVTFGTPVTVTATLTDADGEPAPNVVVAFAAASEIVVFSPAVGTALTDVDGIATITLNAASIDSEGATSITASAPVTFQDATVTTTSSALGITVGGAEVSLGTVTVGTSPISAYGTSSVRVPVLVGGAAATVPISVTFTSPCVSSGKATLSSPVTSSAGIATSTYTDNGCASGTTAITDTITASSGDATATGTITVNPTAVSNISFVSATPEMIGTSTASSSTLLKSSIVKFQVVDSNNQGKPGVGITFSMLPANYSSFGITFTPTTATSDNDGYVTTSVRSGTVPTPAWVVATVTSVPTIKSQSNTLTITTGLPAQNSFSLSIATHNIEGLTFDGAQTAVNIIASDRLGNSVPDGTAINFITEGGNISDGSVPPKASCTTTNGRCSVTFTSSAFRPADGRVTIVAYAVGEESFLDHDGNNYFNAGDTCYDLGDLYIDANESVSWASGENFITYGSGSSACPATTFAVPSKANTCTGTCENNYVRRSDVIVLSGSEAYITPTTVNVGSSCVREFNLILSDINGNPMPAGTTVTTKENAVNWSSQAAGPPIVTTTGTATLSLGGTPVIETNNFGGTILKLKVDGGTSCTGEVAAGHTMNYPDGTFTLVVTTPTVKEVTEITITVTGTQNI